MTWAKMLNGTLSNQLAPSVIIVFEGVLAIPEESIEVTKYYNSGQWDEALSFYHLNQQVIDRLLYLTWKKDYNVHVVTWMNEDMATVIEELVADNNIMVRSVESWIPKAMAKHLVRRPDIICIYDADPKHVLLFGSKARLFTDASQIGV